MLSPSRLSGQATIPRPGGFGMIYLMPFFDRSQLVSDYWVSVVLRTSDPHFFNLQVNIFRSQNIQTCQSS